MEEQDMKPEPNTEPLLSESKTLPLSENDSSVIWVGSRKEEVMITKKRSEPSHGTVRSRTSYTETLIHMIKGNIGGGVFAMGDAFMNAGLLLAPILTVFLGTVCIYNNHLLVTAACIIKEKKKLSFEPSFSETLELCFQIGRDNFKKLSSIVRLAAKTFLIITQLGFCCVYFVFVSSTASSILPKYGINYDVRVYMAIMFVPVVLSCFIRTLKFLTPISLLANICILVGIVFTFYLSSEDLPPISSVRLVSSWNTIPLFIGTVIYSFEGIGLVLPLRNSMKNVEHFSAWYGVLNVGMGVIMALLLSMGTIGFWKYGDNVKGSLTLNLDPNNMFTEVVQVIVAVGIVFSYALQFYIAAELIWNDLVDKYGPFKHPRLAELSMRTVIVFITFFLSAVVPQLSLFISLVGAVSSTALALLFPPLCDIALRTSPSDPYRTNDHHFRIAVDILSLIIAVISCVLGTYCSISEIIEKVF